MSREVKEKITEQWDVATAIRMRLDDGSLMLPELDDEICRIQRFGDLAIEHAPKNLAGEGLRRYWIFAIFAGIHLHDALDANPRLHAEVRYALNDLLAEILDPPLFDAIYEVARS